MKFLKKILSFFCVCGIVITTSTVYAQFDVFREDKPVEVTFSDGVLSTGHMGGAMEGYTNWPRNMTGALCLSLKKYVHRSIAIGGLIGYDKINGFTDNNYYNSNQRYGSWGRYNIHAYNVCADITIPYRTRDWFMFYAYVGGGYTYKQIITDFEGDGLSISSSHFVQTLNLFNFQISPWCFRFGRSFGVSLEIGYGYKGMISIGLNQRF